MGKFIEEEDIEIPEFLKDNVEALRERYGDDATSASSIAATALADVDYGTETEIPKPITDDELHDAIKYYFNIDVPQHSCGHEGHVPPMKVVGDVFFSRHSRGVIHGSRGFSGKTLTLSTIGLAAAVFEGAGVTLLGGSGEQSARVLQYTRGYDTNVPESFLAAPQAPRWMLRGDPTKRKIFFKNGGNFDALMASDRSVRGPHPNILLCDELDSVAPAIWDAALGQPMESRGIKDRILASSTWQNPNGCMTREIRLAREMGFPYYRWCWRCVLESNGGWLSEEAVMRKKSVIPEEMWKVEYDLAEPSFDSRAFAVKAVEKMFDKELGFYEGKIGDDIIIEGPVTGATYATGGDWGKSRDKTWIITYRTDVLPHRIVAFSHLGRIPFPDLVEAFNKQVTLYDSYATHDATGIGAVIHDYLEVYSEPIYMVGKKRNKLFSDFIAGVERNELVSPHIESLYTDMKYATVEDFYSPSGHPPDSIVAAALAFEASSSVDLLI